jgi:hypothetical protein
MESKREKEKERVFFFFSATVWSDLTRWPQLRSVSVCVNFRAPQSVHLREMPSHPLSFFIRNPPSAPALTVTMLFSELDLDIRPCYSLGIFKLGFSPFPLLLFLSTLIILSL